MRFGKLFKILFLFPIFDEHSFSSNRFSQLPHAELRAIAKELNRTGFWTAGDYTHLHTAELASVVFNQVKAIDEMPNGIERINRAVLGPEDRFNDNLERYRED